MNPIQEALGHYQRARAAAAEGGRPNDHYNHGYWAARLGQWQEAIHAYHRALALGCDTPEEAWLNIASIHSERLQDTDRAIAALDEALKCNANYTPAMFNHGHLAEQVGERDRARQWFGAVVEREPNNHAALARVADASVFDRDDDPVLLALRQAAPVAQNPDVWLSLANAEEALGHYGAAWEAMQSANELDRAAYPPYPADKMTELNRLAMDIPLPALQPAFDDGTGRPLDPVFICGMFRTGSTLLEQLLAAHDAFSPLGESDFWPRKMAGAGGGMVFPSREPTPEERQQWALEHRDVLAQVVPSGKIPTDKRPDNLYQIHALGQVLPNARFVLTKRDWRDTLVSVYATRLHPQHGYATDIRAIRRQLALVEELISTWSERYPQRIRVIEYEHLVDNPERTLKALLAWLGQSWQPGVLDFHRLRNSVRTASVWQVREPLGGHRKERWRRFEGPLRAVFGDSLDDPHP